MFTDYFGQALAVGDEVIYPVSSGSNRAALLRCPIKEIVELIDHRDYPGKYLMRADQARQAHPTAYSKNHAPDKSFVLKVEKAMWNGKPRLMSIRYPENVIRVPDGC